MKVYLLGLLAVMFVSACVDIPGFGERNIETTELPPDILVVENVNTIPTPPINTNDQFTTSFEVKNQDDVNEVPNVFIQLFDYGLCIPLKESFTPSTDWVEASGVHSLDLGSLVPGQTEFIEWTFQSPTNEEIGRLETTCPIRFKTSYNFSSISQIDVRAISSEKLKQMQRSGETPTFTPTQTLGRGPIKISFSFGASLPIKASSASFESILPIFITVEDKGQGLFGDIPEKTLLLKVPASFKVKECNKFDKVTSMSTSSITTYTNKDKIPMIRKKSPQLRCSFIVPDEEQVVVEKTYFLSANMNYQYSLTNDIEVEVKPTLAV